MIGMIGTILYLYREVANPATIMAFYKDKILVLSTFSLDLLPLKILSTLLTCLVQGRDTAVPARPPRLRGHRGLWPLTRRTIVLYCIGIVFCSSVSYRKD